MSAKHLIAGAAMGLCAVAAGPTAADVPVRCAASLETVEGLADKVEAKLFEVEITLKHGYGRAKTISNADALIVRLGEYVIATGHLTAAYSAFIGCAAERGQ